MSALPLLPSVPFPRRSPPSIPLKGISLQPLSPRNVLQPSRSSAWPCANADWTINPYRGCEIGCVYCHARYTHEFMQLGEWQDFERQIFFKEKAGGILARDLGRLAARGKETSIAIGTVTDPYQPVEERLRLMRGILEALLNVKMEGVLKIQVTTKSDLILRDLDLLAALSRRVQLSVNITITTLSYDLARSLEPRAPSPKRRLAALHSLLRSGLRCGVFLMPLIPGINDSPEGIDSLAREVKAAGVVYLAEAPLLLRPQGFEPFFRFLRREYPQLEKAYKEAFESSARAPDKYRNKVRRLVDRARRENGLLPFPPSKSREERKARRPAPVPRQLEIPGLEDS